MPRRINKDTLLVRWDEKEQDFKVWFPAGEQCTGGFIIGHLVDRPVCIGSKYFEDTLIKELDKRGYDPKTLRFTIKKK